MVGFDIGAFIVDLIKAHRLNDWLKLLTSIGVSYWSSFSLAMGSSLLAGQRLSFSLGSGMVVGGAAVYWLWLRSPLTKGMMLAVPGKELEDTAQIQVVEKK